MNAQEMKQMVTFAVGLSKMAHASKNGEPVTLSAEENKAMVNTIRTLAGRKEGV